METKLWPRRDREIAECQKETAKGITCEYVKRGKVTKTTATRNKGAAQYPTDSIESRRVAEPGVI